MEQAGLPPQRRGSQTHCSAEPMSFPQPFLPASRCDNNQTLSGGKLTYLTLPSIQ